ncbi:MAG: hypothetical protein IPM48_03515 [Saprospiraceae bacterium]|nr:hypothetical protein [Saprospiraceae bacterium]
MKKMKILASTGLCLLLAGTVHSQNSDLQYFRSWNKNGINVFEPSKTDEQPEFTGLKLRIGAGFSQELQSLTHSNTPVYVPESQTNPINKNLLYGTSATDSTEATLRGFNTAMANLYIDAQLADGIRVSVESYMSSRHHNEFWVKGGYIQLDKLPMFGNPEWFSKYLRLKLGHFQPNFGDMQFRRTDGGNSMFNPFVENYILDAFTTEIGGELYAFPMKGLMLMAGMTGGTLHGNIDNSQAKPAPFTFDKTETKPAFLGKIAYDNTTNDFRYRLSLSAYHNAGSPNQTLYYGDRAGSHYFMVMEQNRSTIRVDGIDVGIGQSTYRNNKDSGRYLPVFNSKVSTFMANAFLKYKGIEGFFTYESASGRSWFEPGDANRNWSQIGAELVYRFLANEQCFVGGRYVSASGRPIFGQSDVSIDRIAVSAGWFPLDYLMIKAEYVTQTYNDFSAFNHENNGKFSGFVLQAAVGF